VADAFFKVRNFGFERGLMLGAVLERFDDFIQKCVDFGAVVALQRLLETLVLDVDRLIFCILASAGNEVERAVGHHRFAKSGCVYHDARRND